MTTGVLDPGRYWVDLIGAERIAKFGGAIKGLNESHPGLVRIISATRHEANEARNYAESDDLTGDLVQIWEALAGKIQDTPERDWVLFDVTAPAIWDYDIATPTRAGADVTSEADTVQRPAPELEVDEKIRKAIEDQKQLGAALLHGVGVVVTIVAVGVAGALAIVLLRKR